MGEVTRFEIDATVECRDGPCGDLRRVVVDPVARRVTHLVVEAKHRQGLGRLVPVDLVDATGAQIALRCTVAEFDQLESADERQFMAGTGGEWGYGGEQVLSWPYYGLGPGSIGALDEWGGNAAQPVTYDKVPVGEVEVCRGDQLHATDGAIGRVQGLVIDPCDHHVTHVLLQEGHLWGRKEVAIPITDVDGVDDGIRLKIAKDQVQDLLSVDLDHGTLG